MLVLYTIYRLISYIPSSIRTKRTGCNRLDFGERRIIVITKSLFSPLRLPNGGRAPQRKIYNAPRLDDDNDAEDSRIHLCVLFMELFASEEFARPRVRCKDISTKLAIVFSVYLPGEERSRRGGMNILCTAVNAGIYVSYCAREDLACIEVDMGARRGLSALAGIALGNFVEYICHNELTWLIAKFLLELYGKNPRNSVTGNYFSGSLNSSRFGYRKVLAGEDISFISRDDQIIFSIKTKNDLFYTEWIVFFGQNIRIRFQNSALSQCLLGYQITR